MGFDRPRGPEAPRPRWLPRSTACLLAGIWLAGCGELEEERPAAWELISPVIIQPNCATVSCHSRATAAAGLDLSSPERGYQSLTGLWTWIVDPNGTREANCKEVDGRVVCQRAFRPLVTPYDPGQSRLINLLRARGTLRMPRDRPLPEADILLIERWILNGAPRAGKPLPPVGAAGARERDAGN